jgi:hypothetical protein
MKKSLFSFIGAILLSIFSYSHWTKPTLLSKSNFEASTVLRWVQEVQIIHKKIHGTYTDSLQKLVFISGSEFSNSRQILEKQLGKVTELSNSQSGPYYYSILKADKNDFLAEARYQGFAQNGEDIWQISSRGDVIHSVSSHLASMPLWIRISRYVIPLLFLVSLVFFVLAIRRKILKRRDVKIKSKR